jgi:hypothetical protein
MKKLAIFIVLALFIQSTVSSQSCLPDGIIFSTQAEIDNFQTNNPNCTEIEGDVEINGDDITNLNGLNIVTSIGGELRIASNQILANLTGLDNVTFIGGDLNIWLNSALTSLTGLDNMTSVGGDLFIGTNPALTSLMGLDNVTSIGGYLRISTGWGVLLTSLTGLDNVTSIGGDLRIYANQALTSLTGLDNVTSVGGGLFIGDYNYIGNPNLISLTGLEGLTSIGGDLLIRYNESLTSLTGLEGLISIGGYLEIMYNDALSSLTGLDNVTSINGDLEISSNDALTSLSGLDNVSSIEGNLSIGYFYSDSHGSYYIGNDALTNLTGLNNLTFIGGYINIIGNDTLTSLTGLGNIDAATISNLSIFENTSLSTCEVKSICDYLASPNGTIVIHDNASGCNSQEEVEEACDTVSVEDVHVSDIFFIFPNPSSTQIIIQLPNTPQKNAFLTIYDINSQQLITRRIIKQKTLVDVSGLPSGFYFIKVADDRTVMVSKMLKK